MRVNNKLSLTTGPQIVQWGFIMRNRFQVKVVLSQKNSTLI